MSKTMQTVQQQADSFQLSETYRQKLNKNSKKYYHAKEELDNDKARELFNELFIVSHGNSGKGRLVATIPDFEYEGGRYDEYVVKLAKPCDSVAEWGGLYQNKSEVQLWNNATANQKQKLTPVIDNHKNHYWLIMPKGIIHRKMTNTVGIYDWMRETERVLDGKIWEEDIRDENIIKLDGDFRLCDYGVPPERK